MERTYIGTAGHFGDDDDGNDKAHNNIAVDGELHPFEHHWQYCAAVRGKGQVPEIEERPSFGATTRILILLGMGLSVKTCCGVSGPAFTIPARQGRLHRMLHTKMSQKGFSPQSRDVRKLTNLLPALI